MLKLWLQMMFDAAHYIVDIGCSAVSRQYPTPAEDVAQHTTDFKTSRCWNFFQETWKRVRL